MKRCETCEETLKEVKSLREEVRAVLYPKPRGSKIDPECLKLAQQIHQETVFMCLFGNCSKTADGMFCDEHRIQPRYIGGKQGE